MKRAGRIIVIILAAILEIFLFLYSDIPVLGKILLTAAGILFCFAVLIKRYQKQMICLNVACWLIFGAYITADKLWQYGSQTIAATAQTVYSTADYHDPVLPLLLRGRTVYVESGDFFENYADLFAEEVRKEEQLDRITMTDEMYGEFAYIGPLPSTLYNMFESKEGFFDEKQRKEYEKVEPLLYVHMQAAEEAELMWLNDEEHNIYVIPVSRYNELTGGVLK